MAEISDTLSTLLENSLKYTNILYRQEYTSQTSFNNEFCVESKYSAIPTDSLLFYVPVVSSTGECKLIVSLLTLNSSGTAYVTKKVTYKITVETNSGTTRSAGEGDIIANRMCIFRFRDNSSEAILCNSPLYDDVTFNSVQATDATFSNVPKVLDSSSTVPMTLVTSKELDELKTRVATLESKLYFGSEDPDVALADKPSGTIYFKYED